MYDILELENNWKKYKKSKRKPWYIFSFIGIIFLLLLYYMFNVININNINKYYGKIKSLVSVENNTVINENTFILYNPPLAKLDIENIEKKELLMKLPILDNQLLSTKSIEVPHIESNKKIFLDIVKTSSVSAYKDVEKRFYNSHEIEDALFLAQSYYKKNNYTKAAFWALETNKLDNNIEDSIFIFVRSKVKLGQKNEGISILKAYIEKSNSIDAKNLLYKIENNK
jgi:hypothetical protein